MKLRNDISNESGSTVIKNMEAVISIHVLVHDYFDSFNRCSFAGFLPRYRVMKWCG